MADTRWDPHADQRITRAGPPPVQASATLILVHGRRADARDVPGLFEQLGLPTIAAIAPRAAGHTWYPLSLLAPVEANQPFLDSALRQERLPNSPRFRGEPSRAYGSCPFWSAAARAFITSEWCVSAQSSSAARAAESDTPNGVSAYSTRGGTWA